MATLTHWKKTVNPEFIGSYALESDQDLILTIKSAGVETITGNGGKKEEKLVIRFVEDVKPMICNRTNAKLITKIHKTPYIEQWSGKKIQLYSSRISAFGEEVDALRIRDFVPASNDYDPTSDIFQLEGADSVESLKAMYLKLPKTAQSNKALNERVKELTKQLQEVKA